MKGLTSVPCCFFSSTLSAVDSASTGHVQRGLLQVQFFFLIVVAAAVACVEVEAAAAGAAEERVAAGRTEAGRLNKTKQNANTRKEKTQIQSEKQHANSQVNRAA